MKADSAHSKRRYNPWSLMACLSIGGLVVVNCYFSFYSNRNFRSPAPITEDKSGEPKPLVVNINAEKTAPKIPKANYVVAEQASPAVLKQESSSKEWSWALSHKPITCSSDVVNALAKPRLADEDMKFCQWALSPKGGQVEVGKSWGKLRQKEEKERFDSLNCNAVKAGKNPSCDDSWGDAHIRYWRSHLFSKMRCEAGKTDNLRCYENDNSDLFCVLRNAVLDFSKVHKVDRGGTMTPSKKFDQDFLSTDCTSQMDPAQSQAFPFPHLFSTKRSTTHCDVVYNGTLLLYSHDDIRNVGHTMNDIMNVWVMLWMGNLSRHSRDYWMLNVDSFKLGHNFNDQPNKFFLTYQRNLQGILKGSDYAQKTLCVSELLVQPTPPRFFIWESWFVDLPCSFVGPSTLYQRWNLHVRNSYNLLNSPSVVGVSKGLVLLIVRNENSNLWGSQRTSRNYLNTASMEESLSTMLNTTQHHAHFELKVLDLATLNFEEQVEIMARSSLVIGMHGAGIAMTMHMSIGQPRCCGVLEIYPHGEFTPIKGHGNMARKMGIKYDRVDIPSKDSQPNGATVPVQELTDKVKVMLQDLLDKPSCVHPDVLSNPFLE